MTKEISTWFCAPCEPVLRSPPQLWPSPIPGCSCSLWTHQSLSGPSRADCTHRKARFRLHFSLTYPAYHTYHHSIQMPSEKAVHDQVSIHLSCVSPSFPSIPFHFILLTIYLLSWRPPCYRFFYTFPPSHIVGNLSFPSPQHLYCFPWEVDKHTQIKAQQKSPQIALCEKHHLNSTIGEQEQKLAITSLKSLKGRASFESLHLGVWSQKLKLWNDKRLTKAVVASWEVRWREKGVKRGRGTVWARSWTSSRHTGASAEEPPEWCVCGVS